MPSLVPGYEYDIFISYRQKDNKGDHWVSEFVNALKTELEATFKEDISIYFDENPHDGLLETHNVDKSLEGKLKCLIFIPIISQTYCDTKSFAWQHEFCAFNKLAKEDQFGRDIKLSNGNVANRILPVKIHDLDTEDKTLLESELGGVLRAIEFIFKSAGVNRPLRVYEDHPQDNQNKTYYRDQINKVANAIKEILFSLAIPHSSDIKSSTHSTKLTEKLNPLSSPKHNVRMGFSIAFVLIAIFSVIAILKFRTPIAKMPNSILVLPFSSQDSTQTYFAEGITVDVITELAKVKNITTLSWNTSFAYANASKPLKEVANETGVSYVLTGKIQQDNDNIRVNVSLVNPENGQSLWAQRWDQDIHSVFEIQKQIAREVADELGVKLSIEENERLDQYSTKNFEAYDLFLKARAENRKFAMDPVYLHRSEQFLEEALKIDPEFPEALTLRAFNRIDLVWTEGRDPLEEGAKAMMELKKSLQLDPYSSDTYIVMGTVNFFLEWNLTLAKKNFEKGWELSNYGEAPISQCFCGYVGYILATGDYHNALALISQVEKLDPSYPFGPIEKALAYRSLRDSIAMRKILAESSRLGVYKLVYQYELGEYDYVIKSFLETGSTFIWPSTYLASAYYKAGMIEQSDSLVNIMISRSDKEGNIDFGLAVIFAARGDKENSIKWFKKAYANRDFWIVLAKTDADLRLIINEPEVKQILKEIGL